MTGFTLLLCAFLVGVLWLMVRPLPPKVAATEPGGLKGAMRAHKETLAQFYGSAAGQLQPDFGPPPDPAPLEPLAIRIEGPEVEPPDDARGG